MDDQTQQIPTNQPSQPMQQPNMPVGVPVSEPVQIPSTPAGVPVEPPVQPVQTPMQNPQPATQIPSVEVPGMQNPGVSTPTTVEIPVSTPSVNTGTGMPSGGQGQPGGI